jgi:putative phage-type endonuclease
MSLTAEQHEVRRTFLGGTDMAAIAGVNPPGWAKPIDVHLEKNGLSEYRARSRMMAMGTLMEDLVASLATEATGMRWRRRSLPVRHPAAPYLGGHIDREAAGYDATRQGIAGQHFEPGLERALLECKWSMSSDGWGAQGTTTVPLHYAVQVQHYLLCTQRPVAILAVLLGYGDFRWYRLEANPELQAQLFELGTSWWEAHGPGGTPPPPDGSESYGRVLRKRYPHDDGEERVATPEQQLLLDELRAAHRAARAAALEEERQRQLLMQSLGTTSKLIVPGAKVSYRTGEPALRVQWEPLATQLLGLELSHGDTLWPTTKKDQAALVRAYALEHGLAARDETGTRTLRVEFDEDEE